MDVTGGALLMRTLILRNLLRRHVLAAEDRCVAVLIPPSVPSAMINLALSFDRRTVVNLNYTLSSETLNHCLQQAGIRKILTSQKVLEKLDLQLNADIVLLDELRQKVSLWDKASSFVKAYLCPSGLLAAGLGLGSVPSDELLTIIFTSGSTGIPKGVMLTQANISHNADAMNTVIHLTPDDVIVGILPFFHSFGYTITLWTVMALNVKGIYHFNPLDARPVGRLCAKHRATILLSTPTFLRNFIRRCDKEDFASIDTVVTGAERLPKKLADAFEHKFGVRPVEGYGTTELSPLVSVNIPPSRSQSGYQVDAKEGTVGRPVPGVAAKIVDLESGQELGTNSPGMLLIKGPNIMKGYLDMPEKTAEVIRNGWYVTGDVAQIDDDGFIQITGRESRFSKIGGEMIPHIMIEDALTQITGITEDADPQIAVTAVSDEKKGERLVVLHETLSKTVDELRKGLQERGLPNICIPSADSFFHVDQIPLLGTGKLDLRRMRQLAEELCEKQVSHRLPIQ
jgi:acyl-[acyl-carrier-protein]-phospholipid O-acyltransferase/long-chain-fatty-acid--[acyl-carrier-protein] ligase